MYKELNNETIVTGRKFRRLIDKKTNTWERFCGWHITERPFTKAIPLDSEKEK